MNPEMTQSRHLVHTPIQLQAVKSDATQGRGACARGEITNAGCSIEPPSPSSPTDTGSQLHAYGTPSAHVDPHMATSDYIHLHHLLAAHASRAHTVLPVQHRPHPLQQVLVLFTHSPFQHQVALPL